MASEVVKWNCFGSLFYVWAGFWSC